MRIGMGMGMGSGSGAPDWSPLNITNVLTWFDGKDTSTMTIDANLFITEWRNKVSAGNPYQQADVSAPAPTAPSYSAADGVVFSGGQNMKRNHTLDGTVSNITFWYVLKLTANTGVDQFLMSHAGTGGAMQIMIKSDCAALRMNMGTTITSSATTYTLLSNNYRLLIYNYIKSPGLSSFIGYGAGSPSGDIGNGALRDAGNRSFNSGAQIMLGAGSDSAGWLSGNLFGMGACLGTMSADELTSLKNWANAYYGSAK